MSGQLAIAAVTRTMQYLLEQAGIRTTTLAPDQAAKETGKRINLFLYHTMHNAGWRNMDLPGRVRKSERGNPPLALNLHYLLTAYGEDGPNLADQELLGSAMLVLHDRPIFKRDYVQQALTNYPRLQGSELADQIDRVRVVPEYLDIENMSRLWTTFQTQYRVSAAYQASVVLIESKRPIPSPLPVTRRGEEDQGVLSDVGLQPMLSGVEYRADVSQPKMPAAAVGSSITLLGDNLPTVGLVAVFRDPLLDSGIVDSDIVAQLGPELGGTDRQLVVNLSVADGMWRAGMLTVELQYTKDDKLHSTNPIPIAIAPQLLTSGGQASVVTSLDENNNRRLLSVNLTTPVRQRGRTLLTLNTYSADSTAQTSTFQSTASDPSLGTAMAPAFDISNVPSGEYWVRIRVDGVESLLMKPSFDPTAGKYRVDFDQEQRIVLR